MAKNRLRGAGKHGSTERHQVGQADKQRAAAPPPAQPLPRLIKRQSRPAEHQLLQALGYKAFIETVMDREAGYLRARNAEIDGQAGAVFA